MPQKREKIPIDEKGYLVTGKKVEGNDNYYIHPSSVADDEVNDFSNNVGMVGHYQDIKNLFSLHYQMEAEHIIPEKAINVAMKLCNDRTVPKVLIQKISRLKTFQVSISMRSEDHSGIPSTGDKSKQGFSTSVAEKLVNYDFFGAIWMVISQYEEVDRINSRSEYTQGVLKAIDYYVVLEMIDEKQGRMLKNNYDINHILPKEAVNQALEYLKPVILFIEKLKKLETTQYLISTRSADYIEQANPGDSSELFFIKSLSEKLSNSDFYGAIKKLRRECNGTNVSNSESEYAQEEVHKAVDYYVELGLINKMQVQKLEYNHKITRILPKAAISQALELMKPKILVNDKLKKLKTMQWSSSIRTKDQSERDSSYYNTNTVFISNVATMLFNCDVYGAIEEVMSKVLRKYNLTNTRNCEYNQEEVYKVVDLYVDLDLIDEGEGQKLKNDYSIKLATFSKIKLEGASKLVLTVDRIGNDVDNENAQVNSSQLKNLNEKEVIIDEDKKVDTSIAKEDKSSFTENAEEFVRSSTLLALSTSEKFGGNIKAKHDVLAKTFEIALKNLKDKEDKYSKKRLDKLFVLKTNLAAIFENDTERLGYGEKSDYWYYNLEAVITHESINLITKFIKLCKDSNKICSKTEHDQGFRETIKDYIKNCLISPELGDKLISDLESKDRTLQQWEEFKLNKETKSAIDMYAQLRLYINAMENHPAKLIAIAKAKSIVADGNWKLRLKRKFKNRATQSSHRRLRSNDE